MAILTQRDLISRLVGRIIHITLVPLLLTYLLSPADVVVSIELHFLLSPPRPPSGWKTASRYNTQPCGTH